VELVLVGLPGSGKTAVGRRLARARGADFVDVDATVEAAAGMSVADIFAREGEDGFRARERAAIAALGVAERGHRLSRVIATGGGAVIDPGNRWRLYRGRRVAWLDAPARVLAGRLAHSATARPLLAGGDPVRTLEELRAARERFYAPAARVEAIGRADEIVPRLEPLLRGPSSSATRTLDARTPIGRIVLGADIAAAALVELLQGLEARRVALASEPTAWRLHGAGLATALAAALPGTAFEPLLLPRGERAKSFRVVERATRELARHHHERRDPLVGIGGGAVTDTAGFVAAIYVRGVPLLQLPTTLLGQLDAALGGKTAIDLPEGKNLVGAFHQPAGIVLDIAVLATLPTRERRAALAEAVKMAALGDRRLFALLETDGPALAAGDPDALASGALAELVERCALAKAEVVAADEREADRRLTLNLGHSLAHALEAETAYRGLLHGEAVALGLRGAVAVGRALGVTPPERAARIVALLDELDLGLRAPAVRPAAIRDRLAADKKVAGGRLRWVLPTSDGVVIRTDVPDEAVEAGLTAALRGAGREAGRSP
jgi:3-dehydroquinate synthetase